MEKAFARLFIFPAHFSLANRSFCPDEVNKYLINSEIGGLEGLMLKRCSLQVECCFAIELQPDLLLISSSLELL